MPSKPSHYQHPSSLKKGDTEYYPLTSDYVSAAEFEGQEIVKVAPQASTSLARQASHDVSFVLRPAYQQQVADTLRDPEVSENDKYVVLQFPRNSDIAAKGTSSTCQDTGTATIAGKKGQRVWTRGDDEEALVRGAYNTYIGDNLRYLQNAVLDMYKEVDTGINLPAQIDLYTADDDEYKFLCIAKGGGPADKTYLYRETKALLTPGRLKNYPVEKMCTPGTAACPPYHIASAISGTSVEVTPKTVKLVSIKYYDKLPAEGNEHDQTFRDVELEKELLIEARNLELGVQFGGKYFARDIRVIRLPCHGAPCLAGMGVPCSADRNIKAKIDREGVWIRKLERNPGKSMPGELRQTGEGETVRVDLNRPMKEILAQLSQYPVSTRLSLNGTIIAGCDIAYAKLKERLDNGESLPQYVKDHPIYCAGSVKTPGGYASGSPGPATVGRMDSYVDQLQVAGGNMIMLAKGNRSQQVIDVCHKHGGFYLGSIGGPAAMLAQGSIKSLEYVEHPELGMEAIWKIEVKDSPVFILVDDKGNDFFKQIQTSQCAHCVK